MKSTRIFFVTLFDSLPCLKLFATIYNRKCAFNGLWTGTLHSHVNQLLSMDFGVAIGLCTLIFFDCVADQSGSVRINQGQGSEFLGNIGVLCLVANLSKDYLLAVNWNNLVVFSSWSVNPCTKRPSARLGDLEEWGKYRNPTVCWALCLSFISLLLETKRTVSHPVAESNSLFLRTRFSL